MSRTFLSAAYRDKDAVKALGARWDADERRWYVPEGLALGPFERWLSQGLAPAPESVPARVFEDPGLPAPGTPVAGTGLASVPRGKTLSQMLQAISVAVSRIYPQGEWVIVEVVDARIKEHVYLEVSERDPSGAVLATARAVIWKSTANKILPAFERATGMALGPGIKLLVQAKPQFKPQYGLSLVIEAIDPDYSLGDLEARKREVRARLRAEGTYGAAESSAAAQKPQALTMANSSQAVV